jgi:hypothetical protein
MIILSQKSDQSKFAMLKSTRILFPIVMGLVLTLSIIPNVYAQDCKASVSQLKLEIAELEKQLNDGYKQLQSIQKNDFAYNTVLGVYELNSQILKIKKDLLAADEKSCASSGSTDKADKSTTAITEDDGQEMDLSATLNVTKQGSKYLIKVDSNIAGGSFSLVATKKGSKSISFKVGTDDAGSYALRTTRNLKGYLLVLKYNGELLDKIQVN